jgi:hypothetical protein
MNRICLLILLGLTLSCSDRSPAASRAPRAPVLVRSQNAGLGTVTSVEPVHIAGGFPVWRNGQEVIVNDGLLIRVDVAKPGPFFPRALTPPLFVLGDSVGLTLHSPYPSGDAILLMDAPPPDSDVALWTTEPGVDAQTLGGTVLGLQQQRALSSTASAGINIRTPPANAPKTPHPTFAALTDSLIDLRVSPEICEETGKECGLVSGTPIGRIDCGSCPTGQLCKTDNLCCTPSTCTGQGRACGPALDGCGNTLDCGTCSTGNVCTAAGNCCTPKTCSELGRTCGTVSDGCGGTLNCGTCGQGQTCLGSGSCCMPKTCAQLGKNCGSVPDGCGGTLNCGSCTDPQSCGGAGTPNVCGTCTPMTQQQACYGRQCGTFSDGCFSSYSCGSCPGSQACAVEVGACGTKDGCGPGTVQVCNGIGCRCYGGSEM